MLAWYSDVGRESTARPAEKALLAIVQQAYVQGVSTRDVDSVLQAIGLTRFDRPCSALSVQHGTR